LDILVTGASGFTARHLIASLRDMGAFVGGFGRAIHPSVSTDVWVSGDLCDRASIHRALKKHSWTHVIHLAGIAHAAMTDCQAYYQVNVFGTENLLTELSAEGRRIEKVLMASTATVYGNRSADEVPARESICPAPINHYGASKLAMEHLARTFAGTLDILITRPFNYTGPGQSNSYLIPKLVSHFFNRSAEITLGNLAVQRDYSDVRDITAYYAKLMQTPTASDAVLNLCSGRAYRIFEIIELLKQITGHVPRITEDVGLMRRHDIGCLIGDRERLQILTGLSPRYAMADTLEYMLSSL